MVRTGQVGTAPALLRVDTGAGGEGFRHSDSCSGSASGFPVSFGGPDMADPRLPCSRFQLLNLVITRGTPPRLEGCRPASRGLMLALMTDSKGIPPQAMHASGFT